jgi:hypothetical protein
MPQGRWRIPCRAILVVALNDRGAYSASCAKLTFPSTRLSGRAVQQTAASHSSDVPSRDSQASPAACSMAAAALTAGERTVICEVCSASGQLTGFVRDGA